MSVVPNVERPKAVEAALGDLARAQQHVRAADEEVFEANRRRIEAQRTANSVFVGAGPGRVAQEEWDRLQQAWELAQDDLELTEQVRATAVQEKAEAFEQVALVVLEQGDAWRKRLERRHHELDREILERLSAL